jgi:hypothetical protein
MFHLPAGANNSLNMLKGVIIDKKEAAGRL